MQDTRHVKGLSDLAKFFDQLTPKLEKNIMRGAMRAAAKPMLDQIKNQIPEETGELRAGIKISTNTRRGVITAKVKATGKHAHLAHWLEYGVAAHKIRSKNKKGLFFGGKYTKVVDHPGIRPRPTFRVALDAQATNAVVAAGNYIKQRLTKEGLNSAASIEIEAV